MSSGGGSGGGALAGITVLDFSTLLPGPMATLLLAEAGAEVIKVERPPEGEDMRRQEPFLRGGMSVNFALLNRGKRSVALDLKHPDLAPVLRRLVEAADVIVENFRPGTAERLGLGYQTAAKWNPRIVYCAISGFGSTGPERDRPGYDLIVQGESGIMDITGDPGGPPTKIGTSVADLVSALYAAQGILLALRVRDQTGKGQKVDVGMIDAMASLLTFNAGIFFATGKSPTRRGNAHPTIVPYETFEAADGWINIAVANDPLWRRFCKACERSDLVDDPRFAAAPSRVENRAVLMPILQAMIASRPRRDWVARLEAAGVPCGEIKTVGEVCTNPAMIERGMLTELDHATAGTVRGFDTPIRLGETPGGAERAPPLLGQHTIEVLTSLGGLTHAEIEVLAARGAVRCAQG